MADLPPGVYELDGQLVRDVTQGEGDSMRIKHRPVALTLAEAKKLHIDWFHPQYGWINEGYKLQSDRGTEDIMADESQAVAATEEQQAKSLEEATSG